MIFLAVIFLTVAGFKLFDPPQNNELQTTKLPDYPRKTAVVSGEDFTLLAPQTLAERRLGLGAVSELPDHYGMIFPGDGRIGIWMKGMSYAIDIIWIDKDGVVLHVEHNAEPASYPKTTFSNPADTKAGYAIELNAGEAKRLNVQIGATITLHP